MISEGRERRIGRYRNENIHRKYSIASWDWIVDTVTFVISAWSPCRVYWTVSNGLFRWFFQCAPLFSSTCVNRDEVLGCLTQEGLTFILSSLCWMTLFCSMFLMSIHSASFCTGWSDINSRNFYWALTLCKELRVVLRRKSSPVRNWNLEKFQFWRTHPEPNKATETE